MRRPIPGDLSSVSGVFFFTGIFRLTGAGAGELFFCRPVPVCDHFFEFFEFPQYTGEHRQKTVMNYFPSSMQIPSALYVQYSPRKNQFRYTIGVIIVVSRLMSTSTT